MREWLVIVTEYAVVGIDAIALLVIVFGTVRAFIGGLRVFFGGRSPHERRDVWLTYARWLIAGLTFQLAADIIETSIRSDWQSIVQLGAIAAIRTFLNYFLERDVQEVAERRGKREGPE
jgi:uncharacterized membrane protein